MGTSHMVLCTGKYMWLMFLFNFMIFIFQIFIKASYQYTVVRVLVVMCTPLCEKPLYVLI